MRGTLALVAAGTAATLTPAGAQGLRTACPPAPAIFPYAPPTTPQHLTIETERPVSSGGMRRFALEYRIQFYTDARGPGMTATLLRSDVPAAMAAGSAMTDIFAPLVGRPLEFFYDPVARKLLLRQAQADALWQLLSNQMVARAQKAKPGEARDVAAMLLNLPPAQREQMLFGDLGATLRFAGQSPGSDLSIKAGSESGDCALVQISGREGWTHGGPGYYTNTRWLVEAASGVVREQREEVTLVQNGGEKPILAARTVRRLTRE